MEWMCALQCYNLHYNSFASSVGQQTFVTADTEDEPPFLKKTIVFHSDEAVLQVIPFPLLPFIHCHLTSLTTVEHAPLHATRPC